MATKYVIEQDGYYLVIKHDMTDVFSNKIQQAEKFDTEYEAIIAAKDRVEGELGKDYKVIGLTGEEFFALMTK
jgi:hypothetical protein